MYTGIPGIGDFLSGISRGHFCTRACLAVMNPAQHGGDVAAVLARAADAVGYTEPLDALCAKFADELVVHRWQLARMPESMLVQHFGVPVGLAVAITAHSGPEPAGHAAGATGASDGAAHVTNAANEHDRKPWIPSFLTRLRMTTACVMHFPTWRLRDRVMLPDHSNEYKEIALHANPGRCRDALVAQLEILILAQALSIGILTSSLELCPASASPAERLAWEWLLACTLCGMWLALAVNCVSVINICAVSPANFRAFFLTTIGFIELGEKFFVSFGLALASVAYLGFLRLRHAAELFKKDNGGGDEGMDGWMHGIIFVIFMSLCFGATMQHGIFMGRIAMFSGVMGDTQLAPPRDGDNLEGWFRWGIRVLNERRHTREEAMDRVSKMRQPTSSSTVPTTITKPAGIMMHRASRAKSRATAKVASMH